MRVGSHDLRDRIVLVGQFVQDLVTPYNPHKSVTDGDRSLLQLRSMQRVDCPEWESQVLTLLKQVQNCVVHSDQNLSDCLRKARVLASRLQHSPFTAWVMAELNGYGSKDSLPDYRLLYTQPRGDFIIGALELRDVAVPVSSLPSEWQDDVSRIWLQDSVGHIESLIRTATESFIRHGFPNDTLPYFTSPQLPGRCMAAWKPVSVDALESVLESVRNRLLDFVLEVESIAPTAGEVGWESNQNAQQRIGNTFVTTIEAGAGNVNVGGQDVVQVSISPVQPKDFGSLERFLLDRGLAVEDVEALRSAIEADTGHNVKDGWGPEVSGWMGTIIRKAAGGGWDVGIGAAGSLLATALARYYGLG